VVGRHQAQRLDAFGARRALDEIEREEERYRRFQAVQDRRIEPRRHQMHVDGSAAALEHTHDRPQRDPRVKGTPGPAALVPRRPAAADVDTFRSSLSVSSCQPMIHRVALLLFDGSSAWRRRRLGVARISCTASSRPNYPFLPVAMTAPPFFFNKLPSNGVGPWGRTGSSGGFDRRPGVLVLELLRAEVAEGRV
jgi:hypothetical protein